MMPYNNTRKTVTLANFYSNLDDVLSILLLTIMKSGCVPTLKANILGFFLSTRATKMGLEILLIQTGLLQTTLWKEILQKTSLSNILENYAQVVEEKDDKGRKKQKQLFPRYHQLDVVKKLLADAPISGVGKRYLIQHSAGSGKSNSIAWLAHQLIGLSKDNHSLFDSVIVVTDRKVLDKQIRDTIKHFAQVSATVGHAERSGDLREFIKGGKKIIITTVQKFPFI